MATLHDGGYSLSIEITGREHDETYYTFTPLWNGKPVLSCESFRGTDVDYYGTNLPDTLRATLDSELMRHWDHAWIPGEVGGAELVVYPHRVFPHLNTPNKDRFTVIVTGAGERAEGISADKAPGNTAAVLTPSEKEYRRFVNEFLMESASIVPTVRVAQADEGYRSADKQLEVEERAAEATAASASAAQEAN